MAGVLAVRVRLLSLPSRRRCFQSNVSPQCCKGGLVLPRSFGILTVPRPCGRWAPGICTAQSQRLGISAQSQEQKSSIQQTEQFKLIYRFPGIRSCRALSRLKLLQTSLTILLLPPVWVLYWQNQIPQSQCLYCTGLACFAAAMLYGMSFYLRRIIGMMYLNEDGTLLKVSHLTFWGKRKDIYCPVESVMTLGDIGENRSELLLRFQQYNKDPFLYFSLRFGKIVDPEAFARVFGELK